MSMISNMTENQLNTEFDFSDDESKKEAHWSCDKNVRDIFSFLIKLNTI